MVIRIQNRYAGLQVKLLGTMQPTSKFGEVFQYSNLMATAAGYIGAHLVYPNRDLGAAYDSAMQEKIFNPLGMKSTTFDYAKALAGNHASPHGDDVDGKTRVASMDINYSIVPARPAAESGLPLPILCVTCNWSPCRASYRAANNWSPRRTCSHDARLKYRWEKMPLMEWVWKWIANTAFPS